MGLPSHSLFSLHSPLRFCGWRRKEVLITGVTFIPGAQEAGESIEVGETREYPLSPKEGNTGKERFPTEPRAPPPPSHSVSAAMVGSRMDLKGWVLKVWVLQGADITTRLDKQEICWEEDLWRIKGASRSRQGKPSEREQVWVCERREGRRIVGRALDWYTVLRKPG